MKKILLSSLIAAAAAVPAFAGINNINYQAVIKDGNAVVANQEVSLKFELLDVKNGEAIVYSEEQFPTTTETGYVSCQLGENADLAELNWGDLSLRVSVNLGGGYEVISVGAVSSVPTALYALRSADSDNLREEIEAFAAMNENRIDKIQKQVDDIDGNFANLGENLDNLVTEMNANFEGVNGQLENLNMVAAVVRENEAAIEELNTNTDAFATMLETRLDKMQNQVDGIDEALEVSGTTDYSALVKDLEALKTQTEEGLAKVEVFADAVDAVEGLVQENEETKETLRNMSANIAQIEGLAQDIEDFKAEYQENWQSLAKFQDEISTDINDFKNQYAEDWQSLSKFQQEISTDINEFKNQYAEDWQSLSKFQEGISTDINDFKTDYQESFQKMTEFQDGVTTTLAKQENQISQLEDAVKKIVDPTDPESIINSMSEQMAAMQAEFEAQIATLKAEIDALKNK